MVPYVLILVPRVLVFSGTFFLVLSYFFTVQSEPVLPISSADWHDRLACTMNMHIRHWPRRHTCKYCLL